MENLATLNISPLVAREKYREYQKHQHWSAPVDLEIQHAYQRIAQGRTVIKALESIKLAGLNAQRLPKLAIVRADMKLCQFTGVSNGSGYFMDPNARRATWPSREGWENRNRVFRFSAGTFPNVDTGWKHEALVPIIPIDKRPKRGLQNYHILWEAEWTRSVPVDPILIRRFGKGDLWLVCAAWNLTEVERAALSAR